MITRLCLCCVAAFTLCTGCPAPKPTADTDAGTPPSAPVTASAAPVATGSPAPDSGAVGAFEGVIEVRLEDPEHGESDKLTFKIQGPNVRFDTPNTVRGMAAIAIYDTEHLKTTVLIEGQKSFALIDAGPPAPVDASWITTRTGKHTTVAGYDCELWEAKSGARKATACVAVGFPYFDVRQVAGTGGTGDWVRELRGTASLPLRFSEYDARGKLTSRAETTRIDRRTMAPTEFTVPPGYTEVPGTPGGNAALRPGLPR